MRASSARRVGAIERVARRQDASAYLGFLRVGRHSRIESR